MDSWDYWRLCDELSINQAAHLLIGMLPGEVEAMESTGAAELSPRSRARYVTGLAATQTAIVRGIKRGTLQGQLTPEREADSTEQILGIEVDADLDKSWVEVDSLRQWLKIRGVQGTLFSEAQTEIPGYLDPNNPRYAPKLAAAVSAWEAVTDPRGKHPRQALIKWLREHAAEFGMTDDEGVPINQAVEDVAKVANWQPGGGAPKTLGE